jgi:hypothetical protein
MVDVLERLTARPGRAPATYREVLAVGIAAAVIPIAIAIVVTQVNAAHRWEVRGGIPSATVFLLFAAIAAWHARILRAHPLLIGALVAAVYAAGSLARESSVSGAVVVLAFSLGGGYAGMRGHRERVVPDHAGAMLFGMAVVIGIGSFLVLRTGPEAAARKLIGNVNGTLTIPAPSRPGESGYRPQEAFVLARTEGAGRWMALARVERGSFGVWRPMWSYPIPEDCVLPVGVGKLQGPDGNYLPGIGTASLITMGYDNITRVCTMQTEPMIIGIAPPETKTIRIVDAAGASKAVVPGSGGLYAVTTDPSGLHAANEGRYAVLFLAGNGRLLDARPSDGGGDLWLWGAGAVEGFTSPSIRDFRTTERIGATISMWLVPEQFVSAACGPAPDGGFATVIHASFRGVQTEFVLGDAEQHDASPDMLARLQAEGRMRPAAAAPCFLAG